MDGTLTKLPANVSGAWTSLTTAPGAIIPWCCLWPTLAKCCGWSTAQGIALRTRERRRQSIVSCPSAGRAASVRCCCVAIQTSRKREHLDRWDKAGTFTSFSASTPCRTCRPWPRICRTTAWRPLLRPPALPGAERRRGYGRTTSRKPSSMRREFENHAAASGEVAEFDYRPTACRPAYRMVVVRKNISVEKGRETAVR